MQTILAGANPDRTRPRAASLQPGMQATGGREQWRVVRRHASRQVLLRPQHLTFCIEVGRCQPLVQGQGVTGGVKNEAAIDDPQRPFHAQTQALEHRGKVPRIDELAIDRGLAANRVQSGTVQKSRAQGMAPPESAETAGRRALTAPSGWTHRGPWRPENSGKTRK